MAEILFIKSVLGISIHHFIAAHVSDQDTSSYKKKALGRKKLFVVNSNLPIIIIRRLWKHLHVIYI